MVQLVPQLHQRSDLLFVVETAELRTHAVKTDADDDVAAVLQRGRGP